MPRPNSEWKSFIYPGGINTVIRDWHSKQPPRKQTVASPSTLTECPRVVWLKKHQVPFTNDMGWGQKQRMLLGRNFENQIALQLEAEGKLLYHWKDNIPGESVKFEMGEGMSRVAGTPDLLLTLDGRILISDAKTSRADSFAYVPLDETVWQDELWYKYKLQVECYYMLCHKNRGWFATGPYSDDVPDIFRSDSLPLPEACHLFSFALDDGVIKREFTWKPTQQTANQIIHYINRWNRAYQSEECPPCQCTATQTKFCVFATKTEKTRTGYSLGVECCGYQIVNNFNQQGVLL